MSMERRGFGFGMGRLFDDGFKSHTTIFVAGLALGSVAVKVLTSRDARELYTKLIAAGLRAKDYTMDTVNTVQEHVEDMVAEAKIINEIRAEEEFYDYYGDDCCCGEYDDDCCCGDDDENCCCGEEDCEDCNPEK